MSVASEITRLQNAKASLKSSINAKTDAQHQITDETIDEYSDFVDSITSGGIPSLPDGYTRVSYIQSSGSQYIDTGYKPNVNTKLNVLGFQTQAGGGALLGARAEGTINRYMLGSYSSSITFFWGNTNPDNPYIKSSVATGNFVNFIVNNSSAIFNATKYSNMNVNTFPDYNIYLFAVNTGGTANAFSVGTIGDLKIYENNTLIHYFMPCYRNSDNEIGFYDIIANEFKTNSGTGSFTYIS